MLSLPESNVTKSWQLSYQQPALHFSVILFTIMFGVASHCAAGLVQNPGRRPLLYHGTHQRFSFVLSSCLSTWRILCIVLYFCRQPINIIIMPRRRKCRGIKRSVRLSVRPFVRQSHAPRAKRHVLGIRLLQNANDKFHAGSPAWPHGHRKWPIRPWFKKFTSSVSWKQRKIELRLLSGLEKP